MLKDVGDLTSTAAARLLDVLPVAPFAIALIWRESLGLLGGLFGDGVAMFTMLCLVEALEPKARSDEMLVLVRVSKTSNKPPHDSRRPAG